MVAFIPNTKDIWDFCFGWLKNKLACMGYKATIAEIMNERCQLGDEMTCVYLNNLLDLFDIDE
ncbi:hypothetical protein HpMMM85_03260 [Helicobacter pylori]